LGAAAPCFVAFLRLQDPKDPKRVAILEGAITTTVAVNAPRGLTWCLACYERHAASER
jgi:hypothetical protein